MRQQDKNEKNGRMKDVVVDEFNPCADTLEDGVRAQPQGAKSLLSYYYTYYYLIPNVYPCPACKGERDIFVTKLRRRTTVSAQTCYSEKGLEKWLSTKSENDGTNPRNQKIPGTLHYDGFDI